MKKLDGFIVKAFVGPFIAILLVVIFILLMQFLWLYIDELVGKGLSLLVIFEFMMWGGCTILPLALPLATLLSSMMTVGSMAENNELMAIKASGVSFSRVILPIMICCAIISLGAFFYGRQACPARFQQNLHSARRYRQDKGGNQDTCGHFLRWYRRLRPAYWKA